MFGEICGRFLGGICGCILGIFVGGFSGVFVGRLRRPFAGTADDPTPRETEDFALRAILRRRSWWGYDCIAASRLEGILGPGCRQLKLAAWDKKRKRQWQERMRAGIKKEAFLASLEVSWFVPYRRLKPSLLPCGVDFAGGCRRRGILAAKPVEADERGQKKEGVAELNFSKLNMPYKAPVALANVKFGGFWKFCNTLLLFGIVSFFLGECLRLI